MICSLQPKTGRRRSGHDLVEAVPASVGRMLSKTVSVPIIGIGAGVDTDGQVPVLHDMLGLSLSGHTPKFVRNFMSGQESIGAAIRSYVSAVKTVHFQPVNTVIKNNFVPHC